jgi:hypothetical protein
LFFFDSGHFCAVDLSTAVEDALLFFGIDGSVVSAEVEGHSAALGAEHCPGVAHIGHVAAVFHQEGDESAGSAAVHSLLFLSCFGETLLAEDDCI